MSFARLEAGDLDLIVDTLKDFTSRNAPLDRRMGWDDTDTCPADVVRAMLGPEVGLHLPFLPVEYGGMGGGAYDIYRLACEFAQIDLGLATSMLAVALGTDPIRVGCTAQQRERWLPRIASEGLIVAYAVTEPEAGSNVQNVQTEARRLFDADGKVTHYQLTGTKQFISNGSIADLYTVLAKTPEGPSFFIVERGTPGLSSGKHEVKHGIRLSDTAQVLLDNVLVPADQLIGEKEGEGLKQANEVFGFTRLMVAGFGLGAGIASLNKAIAYSKQRRQMGTLLCEKQGYTHKLLVPNSVRLAAARAYIEYVADLLDSGDTNRQTEGAIAKLYATEAGHLAADDAVQALGGYGYCVEYEVEKILRDVRILRIYEGTSEILQNIIGIYRMRESVRSKGLFYNRLADQVEPFEHVGGPAAAKTARFLSTALDLLFREKLGKQQYALFECATSIVEIETAIALVRSAALSGDSLLEAQARVCACDVALSVPARLLKLFSASGVLSPEALADFAAAADLSGAISLQSGRLADRDFIARAITEQTR
ncbi:MAG TPA: acyl-CoA dehydrogenase family protein [Thermoanaerobaculia bacterium]